MGDVFGESPSSIVDRTIGIGSRGDGGVQLSDEPKAIDASLIPEFSESRIEIPLSAALSERVDCPVNAVIEE